MIEECPLYLSDLDREVRLLKIKKKVNLTLLVCLFKGSCPDLHASVLRGVLHRPHTDLTLPKLKALQLWRFLISATVMDIKAAEISGTVPWKNGMPTGLRSSSKWSFHHWTVSPVEVNISLHVLNRACAWSHLPLLTRWMIWQTTLKPFHGFSKLLPCLSPSGWSTHLNSISRALWEH